MMAAAPQSTTERKPVLVLGMGLSGLSIVRHLATRGHDLVVADTRDNPPELARIVSDFPGAEIVRGRIPVERMAEFGEIVSSPGIDTRAFDLPVDPIGDIELFAREARAPVIAITGSNGKSTVTMLVTELLRGSGVDVQTGGNIGVPALQLLEDEPPRVYALELSSFQLETTFSLAPVAAVVLNISEDHMDRYADLKEYIAAKRRIFHGARCAVLNRDDPHAANGELSDLALVLSFGLSAPPADEDFGIAAHNGEDWFMHGSRPLAPCSAMRLAGRQNLSNALAAMALVHGAGFALTDDGIDAMCRYAGLPHRCELVGEYAGVRWINDSKGTNVGATLAAIEGFAHGSGHDAGSDKRIVLVAGGQGKGADFSPLAKALEGVARKVILIGEDRERMAAAIGDAAPVALAESLEAAILAARDAAREGDTVLFSPACASFDMFDSFVHRGDRFRAEVRRLVGGETS